MTLCDLALQVLIRFASLTTMCLGNATLLSISSVKSENNSRWTRSNIKYTCYSKLFLAITLAFCRTMARASDDEEDSSDEELLNVPCTAEENDLTGVVQPLTKAAPIVMNIRVGTTTTVI